MNDPAGHIEILMDSLDNPEEKELLQNVKTAKDGEEVFTKLTLLSLLDFDWTSDLFEIIFEEERDLL